MAAVALIVYLPSLFSFIAVGVKRLHDRNKASPWLLVFYLVPIAGLSAAGLFETGTLQSVISTISLIFLVWALVELGFRRGTIGGNPYGPDPVAPKPAQH